MWRTSACRRGRSSSGTLALCEFCLWVHGAVHCMCVPVLSYYCTCTYVRKWDSMSMTWWPVRYIRNCIRMDVCACLDWQMFVGRQMCMHLQQQTSQHESSNGSVLLKYHCTSLVPSWLMYCLPPSYINLPLHCGAVQVALWHAAVIVVAIASPVTPSFVSSLKNQALMVLTSLRHRFVVSTNAALALCWRISLYFSVPSYEVH